MVIQRLGLFIILISTSFCTDHGLQSGIGDKIVSKSSVSVDAPRPGRGAKVLDSSQSGDVPRQMNLNPMNSTGEDNATRSPSSPLVATAGQGVCDSQTATCGPSLTVHFPIDPLFQEGSGGPTEPMEVHGILEFFQPSDCLKSYVQKTRDLRTSYRSGCVEVEQGTLSIKDGGTFSLSLGDYYVRVRGYDGAPYTHFVWAHKGSTSPKELFIEQLDIYDSDDVAASAR